ncbi:tRNA (guanine-N1)-methyltransferase [Paenibacillus curdlanolyticus YK9]|uniref:tRNA (guanine-N(1)-)-methyltransferase n=1 Tax=Paenibacillus curdlanolyticus YK9 TaxID=717606 RepID=E0I420_9BACL|nr:tRNA (guanosine(37)-N1)-methyltransferase TrmD [Paenibacillus curdlanolyticus]EFM13034.1 tRNA (guanine-N1)-methyltransferase [Paenibacillus curdlanolyticus YK9]
MQIDVLTLFPEMFDGVFGASILGKARDKGIVSLKATNFRQFSTNKHSTVDDYPYGGGGGMVLKPEPMFAAVEHLVPHEGPRPRIILLCPQGETFTQRKAEELSQEKHLIFVCGHYEGYDERIREHLVTDELSIGDYVLTGGELPAMVAIDSIVRLLPGVLGNETSAVTDSFSTGLLEYPHYTRPAVFRDWEVPEVLISGNHARIDAWRREQSLLRTLRRRPELLDRVALTPKEKAWLQAIAEQESNTAGSSDSE